MYKFAHFFVAAWLAMSAQTATAQRTPAAASPADLAARLDAAIAPYFKPEAPGATLIVTRDGKTVFRKAYGMASLDARLALEADMSLRIGSLTKQFTASAILLLAEQGKLSLKDDLRRFLPDFPDQGRAITIEHLLTHTSGIADYTTMPGYVAGMARDMSVNQMIDTFKNVPRQFAPGQGFAYSNSGYFLLGAIIEKVSGQRYADFLAQQLFEPLGMQHTAHAGFERRKIVQAQGYSSIDGKFVPHAPLSMSQAFAAGALVSTVDDLARWDGAIADGKLLTTVSWRQAFTPHQIAGGGATAYGYGWGMEVLKGSAVLAHGGGINGFSSYALRLPDGKVYVAVLANSESGLPEMLAYKTAAIVIGKPFPDHQAIALDAATLDAFVGAYKVNEMEERHVFRDGNQLYLRPSGSAPVALTPHSSCCFHIAGTLMAVRFDKNAQGEVVQMTVSGRGPDSSASRVPAVVPAGRITLAPGVFERYVGKYELAPGFVIDIKQLGGKYIAQASREGPQEIFPLSDVLFYSRTVDARLRFEPGADGVVRQLVFLQGGREIPGRRQ